MYDFDGNQAVIGDNWEPNFCMSAGILTGDCKIDNRFVVNWKAKVKLELMFSYSKHLLVFVLSVY